MADPGNYNVTVWACRREDGTEATRWQARASWGFPEQQVTGEPCITDTLAIGSAVRKMKERQRTIEQALETGAFV